MNHKRQKQLEAERRYREKNGDAIRERAKLRMRKLWKDDPELARKKQRQYRFNMRERMIKSYGGICKCCGEKEIKFLTFDHINGDGRKERRERGLIGSYFYAHLLKNHPKNIQILCYNCNCSKGNYGKCPHNK